MTAYRYSTWHGYWIQRDIDDLAWLVHAPDGRVLAKAFTWQKAMWFAVDTGNAAAGKAATATTAANATLPAGSERAARLENDGLPPLDDERATAAWLAGLGNAGRKDG